MMIVKSNEDDVRRMSSASSRGNASAPSSPRGKLLNSNNQVNEQQQQSEGLTARRAIEYPDILPPQLLNVNMDLIDKLNDGNYSKLESSIMKHDQSASLVKKGTEMAKSESSPDYHLNHNTYQAHTSNVNSSLPNI
jgi:hypothetical protein